MPMRTSRVIPPASPTTMASTMTPKMSSSACTAANPPLSPKTNVPARLRTSSTVGSKPCSTEVTSEVLGGGEPRAGRGDQRLYPRRQCGMEHRGEPWVVVGGQFGYPARFLRLLVRVRIGAADGPENRRHTPLAAERSEVLAGRDRRDRDDPVFAEMVLQRGAHPLSGAAIVADELITIERRDLRRSGCTRRLRFSVDDPLDRVEYVFPGGLVEGPDVQLDDRFVRDDVLLRPRLKRADVTTADCEGATSRDTIVWRRSTVAAAMTTGSMLASGIEPWAPRPNIRICKLSAAEVITPERIPIVPAGDGMTCWPRTTSGFGNLPNKPSSIIARAPAAVSSAGWNTAMSVPLQRSRALENSPVAPASQATCMSWPQACMTPSTALA